MPWRRRVGDARRRIYEVLEGGPAGDRTSWWVDRGLVALIVVNVTAVVLELMPQAAGRYAVWFDFIEYGSLVVFTAEYALRVWVAVEHAPHRHLPHRAARLRYVLSGPGIIDLLAVLPFWLAFLVPAELKVVLVLRIIRFLKITRYSPAMRSLLEVIYSERRALFGCIVILTGATLIAAAVMHLVEGRVQPDKLGTIPDAMWWAIVTLGTIGYGDVVPVTALGKLIAAATIFLALVMIALPVGIIANGFADEIHRRDFIVTWGMLARVPYSPSSMPTRSPTSCACCGHNRSSPASPSFAAASPPTRCIIAAGEVEIELPHERVRLGAGQFFGEVAVLRRARRSANVTALVRTSLLVLDAQDLHALMERDHRIADGIREVARSRIRHEIVTPRGDIVTEEIRSEEPHPGGR